MTPEQALENIDSNLNWLQGFLTGISTERSEHAVNEAQQCIDSIFIFLNHLMLSTIKNEVTKTGTSNCPDVGEPMPVEFGPCFECGNPVSRFGEQFCQQCKQ